MVGYMETWLWKVFVDGASSAIGEPSIDTKVNISTISVFEPCWMDSIVEFLADDRLPSEAKEAEKVRRVSTWFWLSEDLRLYQRSFGNPYLLSSPSNDPRVLVA